MVGSGKMPGLCKTLLVKDELCGGVRRCRQRIHPRGILTREGR